MSEKQHLHFVGVGGIGMSALAQFYRHLGYRVSGSDRGRGKKENAAVFAALAAQGIEIYPQNGSFLTGGTPDFLVYSSAIEKDNPDFTAAPGVPKLHRSQALQRAISESKYDCTIAVSGSCGKSSTTAYLAQTLCNLGYDAGCLNGAAVKCFRNAASIGNFHAGSGKILVFEADESDKSLVNYSPDYAIVLNLGTDHYPKEELGKVFSRFLANVKRGAVLGRDVFETVELRDELDVSVFEETLQPGSKNYAVSRYAAAGRVAHAEFASEFNLTVPQTGFHNALNALAVFTLLDMMGAPLEKTVRALETFDGVGRRFDFKGKTASGAFVYDDYAHNPEKIAACLHAAREVAAGGKVLLAFQPHGYGPWGFMNAELGRLLKQELHENERFYLLEPYYAGGTSSMKPSSREICAAWQGSPADERFACFPDRTALTRVLEANAKKGDAVVIMGARDNSLADYASSLTV